MIIRCDSRRSNSHAGVCCSMFATVYSLDFNRLEVYPRRDNIFLPIQVKSLWSYSSPLFRVPLIVRTPSPSYVLHESCRKRSSIPSVCQFRIMHFTAQTADLYLFVTGRVCLLSLIPKHCTSRVRHRSLAGKGVTEPEKRK